MKPTRAYARPALLPLLVVALVALGCAEDEDVAYGDADAPPVAEVNMLTDAEEAEGWTLLFDGESFDGWRGIKTEEVATEHWKIEDGTLHKVASGDVPLRADGQPQAGGDIMTARTYDDFELSFEFMVDSAANSGIKYNVDHDMSMTTGGGNALGFEYQVLDDEGHPDAKNGIDGNRTVASLYDLKPAKADKVVNPPGEWNAGRIVFQGTHGEHWLNGEKVLEYDLDSDDFRERLAASKYAPIEGFADRRPGHIVLQDHNDNVWYRNIKIRELPPQ